ncbi:hypothetical protein LMIY3S_00111 [Labrys miyagiensis]
MGFDVGEGHFTAASYFQGVTTERNNRFVDRYRERYGDDEPTNMCLEASYFQVHLFARALEQTNSLEASLLRNSIMGTEFDAPQGCVSINPSWGHADVWARIGRVNRLGQFDIVYQSPSNVKADPYLVGHG